MMKRALAALGSLIVASSFFITSAEAQISGGTWTLTTEDISLNLLGVSPFVERTSNNLDRIWFPGEAALPDPMMVVDCTETGSCTRQTLGSRFGSDPTVVTLKDGTRKAFFVNLGPSGKKISFATITGNTLSHGAVSDLNVDGASVSQNEKAWGVPDSVVLPDGRVRIYWVLSDFVNGKPGLPENLVSATSTDANATTFVRDPGIRLTGGYVDSKILRAKDGDWVMIVSTGPGAGTQFLYMATSSDGLSWDVNTKPISSSSESALDPTGYETGTDTWRIYYVSGAPGMTVDRTYKIKRAILTWKQAVASPSPSATNKTTAAPSPSPSPSVTENVVSTPISTPSASSTQTAKAVKKTTITCIKGKTIKKVTAVNPKCPTGYKKK